MPTSATACPPSRPGRFSWLAALCLLGSLFVILSVSGCATDNPNGPTLREVVDFISGDSDKEKDEPGEEPVPEDPPDGGTDGEPGGETDSERAFTHYSSNRSTTLLMPDYEVVVSYGDPFGISSLKMAGQQPDFVNRARLSFGTRGIVADWEWFRVEVDGKQEWRKLKVPTWPVPVIDIEDDRVSLRFTRSGVILNGIELDTEFVFYADRPAFDVTYTIRNGTDQVLVEPYTMIGFPGFTNFNRVIEVATAEHTRRPRAPHQYFEQESISVGGEALLLLHNVVPPSGDLEDLYAAVILEDSGRFFTLESSFTPTFDYSRVYSAHTNKPGYLTSHLYSFYESMLPGEEQSATIRYAMTDSAP